MIKKEITYGEKTYIAYDDIIGGRQVFIIYMGSHPCAYVESNIDYFWGRQDFTEPVHWGFTFYDTLLHWKNELPGYDEEKMKKYYIGWDYGHISDYATYKDQNFEGKKWTTDEIIEEIKRAVEWLNEKENKQND